ncbi:hypothetical protein SDC9_131714 [bioreactor metagenome]|uniref:Uncharacterized protein n=1 Tax=bioreactor metagenome TaxID=1076179 RepID=A0A645D5X1_9ZZZZ
MLALNANFQWCRDADIENIRISLEETETSPSEQHHIADLHESLHGSKQKIDGKTAAFIKPFPETWLCIVDFLKSTEAIGMHDLFDIFLVYEGQAQLFSDMLGDEGSPTAYLTGNSNDSHRHLLLVSSW